MYVLTSKGVKINTLLLVRTQTKEAKETQSHFVKTGNLTTQF